MTLTEGRQLVDLLYPAVLAGGFGQGLQFFEGAVGLAEVRAARAT